MKLLLKASKSSGVKIATHGSIHFARTRPPENEALSFAGSVSLFFASSENSKWPLNATVSFPLLEGWDPPENSAGVAEWEEPRDSGLFACPQSGPLLSTFQHNHPLIPRVCIDPWTLRRAKPLVHAVFARVARWDDFPQFVLQREGLAGRKPSRYGPWAPSKAAASAAATIRSTLGTSSRATTSWILGAAL